jgi:hypothetical protein
MRIILAHVIIFQKEIMVICLRLLPEIKVNFNGDIMLKGKADGFQTEYAWILQKGKIHCPDVACFIQYSVKCAGHAGEVRLNSVRNVYFTDETTKR